MARPTWDDVKPREIAARVAAKTKKQAADLDARKNVVRLGPPGWAYDAVDRRWRYEDGEWALSLVWVPPSYGFGFEWRVRITKSGSPCGGASLQPIRRVKAMEWAVDWMNEYRFYCEQAKRREG